MTAKAPRPPITAAKFLSMSGTEGYELVDGLVREKAMGALSSWIQAGIQRRLSDVVGPAGLGFVFESECMYQCFPHKPEQVRKPDASFVRRGRLPGDVIPEGILTITPDFVAEVVSPKEKAYDLEAKVQDFLTAGVPLLWVVWPKTRRVAVYVNGVAAGEHREDHELTGDPVVPGFRVKVADLFPPAPPPA